MRSDRNLRYEFGPFRLEPDKRLLLRNGVRVPLQPKAFKTLSLLMERHGQLVTKDELLVRIWPNIFVQEGSLAVAIAQLRKALGSERGKGKYIQTISKAGYRFSAPVTMIGRVARRRDSIDREVPKIQDDLSSKTRGKQGRPIYEFGPFRLDPLQCSLFRNGQHVPLQPKTFDTLLTLVENRERALKKEDFLAAVWPDTFVDEGSLIVNISLLRKVFGDGLESRSYITTIPGFGYQFIAPVKVGWQPIRNHDSIKTDNPEVYELYLKGRFLWGQRSEETLREALKCFQQAISKDKKFAPAYAGIADVYNALVSWGVISAQIAFPRATSAARQALEIDPGLAEAYASLAYSRVYVGDWDEVAKSLQRASKLNPGDDTPHHWYASLLTVVRGHFERSVTEMKKALQVNPASLIANTMAGANFCQMREYARAEVELLKTLKLDPNYHPALVNLGRTYVQLRRYNEAVESFRKAISLSSSTSNIAELAHAYFASGQKDKGLQLLQWLHRTSRHKFVSPYGLAMIYTALGDHEAAFAHLALACEQRTNTFWMNAEARFDDLRGDHRFGLLLRSVGHEVA